MENIVQSRTVKVAAGTASHSSICPAKATEIWRGVRAVIMPNADSAANGTNFLTLRLYKGSGTGTPVSASVSTASVGLTKGVGLVVEFTGTGSDIEFSQASPLTVQVAHAASGVAIDAEVSVELEPIVRGS